MRWIVRSMLVPPEALLSDSTCRGQTLLLVWAVLTLRTWRKRCRIAQRSSHISRGPIPGELGGPLAPLAPSKIRSLVVLKLLCALIDWKHPVFDRPWRRCLSAPAHADLRQNKISYADTESERPEKEREGVIPATVLEEIQRCCRAGLAAWRSVAIADLSTRTQRLASTHMSALAGVAWTPPTVI